jgi:anthranilate 1,2-dioxygenase (deaminating, decarboxylating) large subunit
MIGNRLVRIIALMGLFAASTAMAYDEPAVNLGYTSFYDGGPPAGLGLYFQDYFEYYTASRLNDNHGNKLALPRTDLQVTANVLQLIYITQKKFLGANVGINALVPTVLQARVNDGLYNEELKAENGFGDLFLGPALQFAPIMRKDGKTPLYVQRLELDTVIPIGRYNRNYAINPSSHFWSLNPYWAGTLWFTPQWSIAFRLHYLWNAKNMEPNVSFGPNVHSTQAGQAFFADFALGFAFTQNFTAGVNSYYFNQFTDTKANGVSIPNRREKVWAIGPGMECTLSKNTFLFFNLYFEQDARNRPQGTNAMVRFVAHL